MITIKSQFLQLALSAIMFLFVIGVLSMIWPGIIALLLGVLLLLQSFSAEQEITALSWTEIDNFAIALALIRRSDLPTILS